MKRNRRTISVLVILLSSGLLATGARAQGSTATATTSGFITTADGVRIHYLEAGKGSAILFVPGWTMPAWIWERQIEHFSKTHRVVAMDPRSQGDSSQPTEGHYPAARARDIKAVVDQLKLAPAVLVGWSLAVTELASYLDQFGTDTIAGFVLVDGVAGWDADSKVTQGMLQFAGKMQRDRAAVTSGFVRSMYRKPQGEEYLKRVTEASLRTPTNSAIALFVGALVTDNRAALGKSDKPTLIVLAQGPFVPVYQEMQKRAAGSQMEVFENAGHALFVDESDRFNSLLDDFLKSLH